MKKLLMAFAVFCSASVLHAEADYYAMASLWAPGQIPMSSSSVIYGVRGTVFYGDCSRLNGLDLAIGANRARESFNGLAIAGVFNRANNAAGVQLGFANMVENEFSGLQAGVWNHAGHGYGVQLGGVNTAGYFAGLQLGIFNWADDLDGLQLGLVNVIADQSLYVLPFLNIGF